MPCEKQNVTIIHLTSDSYFQNFPFNVDKSVMLKCLYEQLFQGKILFPYELHILTDFVDLFFP